MSTWLAPVDVPGLEYLQTNAVFGISSSLTGIWKYPLVKSNVLNKLDSATESRQSWILERGNPSGFTSWFTRL